MTQARYDAVADFYASGFDSIDDPATRAPPEPDWDQAHDADRKPVFLAARLVKLPYG
jgi:hypothetical protein